MVKICVKRPKSLHPLLYPFIDQSAKKFMSFISLGISDIFVQSKHLDCHNVCPFVCYTNRIQNMKIINGVPEYKGSLVSIPCLFALLYFLWLLFLRDNCLRVTNCSSVSPSLITLDSVPLTPLFVQSLFKFVWVLRQKFKNGAATGLWCLLREDKMLD